MQILYVVAMIAVFVLCLALLSTACKILRSSRSSSGQLAVSRIYEMDRSEEESREEKRSEERSISSFAVEHPASDPVIANRVAIAEIAVPEVILAETIAAEPVPAAAIPEQSTSTDTAPKPRADKAVSGRKPPLRVYNYALECLLIGVSAWLLVKTQRSTLRYSSPSASRDRVA